MPPAAAAAAVAVRGLQPKPESDPRWRTRPSGCGWTLKSTATSHVASGHAMEGCVLEPEKKSPLYFEACWSMLLFSRANDV